ncbi:hypothetical protein B6N60_04880 [Richelia sinica FACHB-800]|uniref:Uncharacterized protein n=1 Tax=Richelia sinica FACHB-800 TaxID=1357546 RepID=A0A975TCG2_9NOST|nr:hypothetical protein B6N60_04880 [Richelia sinica FACHB-800]
MAREAKNFDVYPGIQLGTAKLAKWTIYWVYNKHN